MLFGGIAQEFIRACAAGHHLRLPCRLDRNAYRFGAIQQRLV
jgi:hypothetical protein